MSVSVQFNGNTYLIPTTGEVGWSAVVTAIFQDIGASAVDRNTTQTIGGAKTFSGSVNVNALTLSTALPIGSGGTGATTAAAARTALGSGLVGDAVFIATTQATARSALGSTTVGDAVFVAPDQATARSALGSTTVGDAVFVAATAAAARSAIGLGSGAGIQVGSPTGGDKGAGTVNADVAVYVDGRQINNMELMQSQTVAATTPVVFALDSTYKSFFLKWEKVSVGVSGQGMQVQVSTDGGVTYFAGATDYVTMTHSVTSAGGHSVTTGSTSNVALAGSTGTTAANSCGGFLFMDDLTTNGTNKPFYGQSVCRDDGATATNLDIGGMFVANNSPITHFRLSTGTGFTGIFSLYGIRTS